MSANDSRLSSSALNRLLKLSAYAFCQGAPGSMYNVPTPVCSRNAWIAWAMNYGPLSLRM